MTHPSRRSLLRGAAATAAALPLTGLLSPKQARGQDAPHPTGEKGDVAATVPEYATDRTEDRLGLLMPKRPLGDTGEFVSMFCVGGSHYLALRWKDNRRHAEAAELAFEKGIRFWDTAEQYGGGQSEELIGEHVIKGRRDLVFIMTKVQATTRQRAKQDLEQSRRLLGVEQIDLWQMHHIAGPRDVDNRINNGVLDVMLNAKAKGQVRHLGITGHNSFTGMTHILDFLDARGLTQEFATLQFPVNVAEPSFESFCTQVMPRALQAKLGILAMKTAAYGHLFGERRGWGRHARQEFQGAIPQIMSHQDNMDWVYSQPISSAVIGFDSVEQLAENAQIAWDHQPMSEARQAELVALAKPIAGQGLEFYKNSQRA